MNESFRRPVPQLLVVITDMDRRDHIAGLLQALRMRSFQCRGKGTATSEIMDLLGLEDKDKSVAVCLVPKQIVPPLMEKLRSVLRLDRRGGGIAFTLPCSGIVSPLLKLLEEDARSHLLEHIESEVNQVKKNATHDLVVAVINRGFSEDLVHAAKQAGATGGTVIHANHMLDTEKVRSWGIAVHDEKEIVLLLVSREQKTEIMKAASKACGMSTEARGLVLSLPVDEIEGLEIPRQ